MSRSLNKLAAVAVVAMLISGSLAQAAIMGTATLQRQPPGTPFGNPDAALPAPWVGISLGLQQTAGESIAAVDVLINGQLHQRWNDTDDDGIFEPTANSANQANGDSHIRAVAGALFGAGPAEDNSGAGSPLADTLTQDYGVGTFVSGAWGIPLPSQTLPVSLAYIVIPEGSQVNTNIRVLAAGQDGGIIADLGSLDFPGFGELVTPPIVDDLSHVTTVLNEVVNLMPMDSAPGTPPVTWSALAGPTYTPDFGALPGAPGIALAASWDPATQKFSWDTSGSTRGRYVWTGDASNAAGSDGFSLTVDVTQVPEPASIALFGLALVGLAGFRRN